MSISHSDNQITVQLGKLRRMIFTRGTAATLGESFQLLIAVLKEVLVLVWLAVCFVLVAFEWVGHRAITAGRSTRIWFSTLEDGNPQQTVSEIAADTGKSLVARSQKTIAQVMVQAKKQLGLPIDSSETAKDI